jgi:ketosteroid isomerase-like protein
MSEENVAIARALHERAAHGDFSDFSDWAEDFEFVTSPELPDAGIYRGEKARAWIASWVDSFDGLTIEATEILDAGDKVVAGIHQRGTMRDSETMVEGRWWQVLTFSEGLIVRSELYPEREEALEAAGLSE